MKSYLRFLSRNKLYTAIEVVGLCIALTFVIILGAVMIDKSQVNDNIRMLMRYIPCTLILIGMEASVVRSAIWMKYFQPSLK